MDAFRMLVVATVTVAILYIIYGFFANPYSKPEEQFRTGLDYAEGIEGRFYKYELRLQKDSGANASALDTRTRSVRFECNEADCANLHLNLKPRIVTFSENVIVDAYFRCVDKEVIKDCVIYFGSEPAQLEVENAAVQGGTVAGQTAALNFDVKNTGELDAIDSAWQIGIYAKQKQGSGEILVLKKEFSGEIAKVGIGETAAVTQQLELSSGKYVAKISASGEDAGSAKAEKEFEVAGGISAQCSATSKGDAQNLNGVCRTKYACSGCGSGAECKVRWIQKGIDENRVAEIYSDGVYIEQPAVGGECQ